MEQHRTERSAPKKVREPKAGSGDARVRLRAYQIFEARNKEGVAGDALSDWLRAEQEVGGRTGP